MTQAALVQLPAPARLIDEDRVRWLLESVRGNRFLPQPEANNVFVGDGDFRAIGAEFLGHFIRIGQPIGCSRMCADKLRRWVRFGPRGV